MYSRTASWLWNSKMSKPLSRQVTFAHLSYHLSGEEPAKKKAAGPTTFGKPKILDEGGHVKANLLPKKFQYILTPETPMAACAAQRKPAVFVKHPALSSTPSPSSNPGKKTTKIAGTRHDDVSAATVALRPAEFPDQTFKANGKALFCEACGTEVGSAKTAIKKHLATAVHVESLGKYNKRRSSKADTAEHLRQSRLGQMVKAMVDPMLVAQHGALGLGDVGVKGMENVPMAVQVHRFEILEALIHAGIPVSKVNSVKLRRKLEENVGKLVDASHLVSTYLTPLLAKEFETLKMEVGSNLVGIYSDGTTQLGEAFAIVARWVDEDMKVQTRVIEVEWFAFCLDHKELSQSILRAVCVTLHWPPEQVIAFMTDRCAVNLAAYRNVLHPVFSGSDQNDCLGHTAMHVAEAMSTPILDEFFTLYNLENALSNRFRRMFMRYVGFQPLKASGTRWYGEQDARVACEGAFANGKMKELAAWMVANKYCEKTAAKMLAVLSDPRKLALLQLETAVEVVVGVAIKVMGRTLEGDGYVQVTGHEQIAGLSALLNDPLTPGMLGKVASIAAMAPVRPVVAAVAALGAARPPRQSAQANAHAPAPGAAAAVPMAVALETYDTMCKTADLKDVEALKRMVKMIVHPAKLYFERVFLRECSDQMERLVSARVFCPLHVAAVGVHETDVDKLVATYRFF